MPINLSPYDWFRMTDQSYDKKTDGHFTEGLPAGWKIFKQVEEKSGYAATVFINEKTKELVVSHRGTQFSDDKVRDLLVADGSIFLKILGYKTDTSVLANKPKAVFDYLVEKLVPNQFQDSYKLIDSLLKDKALKGYTIANTGHSLGGFIAETVGMKYQQKAVTFDAPANISLKEMLIKKAGLNDKEFEKWCKENITSYKMDSDIVNVFSQYGLGNILKLNNGNTNGASLLSFGGIDNHGRDNIIQFFDKKTGQIRQECFDNQVIKALTQVPTYKPVSSQAGGGYDNKEFITIKPLTYIKTTISDTTEEGCARAKSSSSGLLSKIQSFN